MEFSTDDPMDVLERGLGLKFTLGGTLSGWGTADGWQTLRNGARIALEVEDQQGHPSTNVLKYWPWLDERPSERLLLIQVFGPWSRGRISNRGRLATWIGSRIEAQCGGRFHYRRIDLGFPEFDGQLAAVKVSLAELADRLG